MKDKKLNAELKKTEVLNKEIELRLQEKNEFLNTEDKGYLEVETERERTLKVTQDNLKSILPVQNTQSVRDFFYHFQIFNLKLDNYGPY